jgi:hypothetical protein
VGEDGEGDEEMIDEHGRTDVPAEMSHEDRYHITKGGSIICTAPHPCVFAAPRTPEGQAFAAAANILFTPPKVKVIA